MVLHGRSPVVAMCIGQPLGLGRIARAKRFCELGLADNAAEVIRDMLVEPENAGARMLGRTGHRKGDVQHTM